jgi:hypothetical protein
LLSAFTQLFQKSIQFIVLNFPTQTVFQNLFLDGIEGIPRKKAEIKGQTDGQRPKQAAGDLSIHFSKLGKDQLPNKQEESGCEYFLSHEGAALSLVAHFLRVL